MKMKPKMIVLVEIAIVLCSLFLVASPAIATAQTTQTVTTTSEDDYVLGVYGNANEDDTIDMRDLTYVKLIFFGKKPETELADAKYDGKINPLDFIQIKLIIVGKEKELTIVDSVDRIVTVKKPVRRIVVLNQGSGEMIQVLNAVDKVVGVSAYFADQVDLPEFSKLPSVGRTSFGLDYEAILNLNPDIILTYGFSVAKPESKLPGSIKVIGLDFYNSERMKKLGYIIDKKDAVEEFIDWYEGYVDDKIKSKTERLSEEEKPKIYYGRHLGGDPYKTYNKHSRVLRDFIEIAGGRNIAADLGPGLSGMGVVSVDPEWVIEQNPDIIVISVWSGGGYNTDDLSGMKEVRDSVMNRPELVNIDAVKSGRVYVISTDIWAPPSNVIVSLAYYAKWFHLDLFEDLDPRAIHQEYLTRFRRIDFNVYEHGVFVYPPLKD